MPTATTTVTHNGQTQISLKTVVIPSSVPKHTPFPLSPVSPSQSKSSSSVATVRSLYNRATRAFLHREVPLTHTLLEAAFAILQPPPTSSPDIFVDDRRKWDILRITLESTVYASGPSQSEKAALPDPLRASLSETPHTLISKFYNRSLCLFTPADSVTPSPNPVFIPPQVLATLVLASLKVECPDLGRSMVEDWLARRDPPPISKDEGTDHEDGYAKILDLYCLHVLPKLQQWDYAFEFLEYESELLPKTRERLKSHLKALHSQQVVPQIPFRPSIPDSSDSATPRPPSPAHSSSSSSSLSTTSTHTVVPSNRLNGFTQTRSRSSSRSTKSDATARATVQPHNSRLSSLQTANGHIRSSSSRRRQSRTGSSSSTSVTRPSTLPRAQPVTQSTAISRLSTYSLVKEAIQPYLTTSRLTTLFLLFVVFPLVSLLIRRRRRAARIASAGGTGAGSANVTISNAELVRRRLGGVEGGMLGRIWGEVVRAVVDTVKMAGSGLV